MVQKFILIYLTTVLAQISADSDRVNIAPRFRPIPPVNPDLLSDDKPEKLEFNWCTVDDCNKKLETELDGLPDEDIIIVVPDLEELFDSFKYAEHIATGCVEMNYPTILIRWDRYQPNYYQSVANTHGVARQVARHLVKALRKVHIIGLGMGAHIAGYVGKRSNSGGKIHRITALDPTRILYEYNEGPPELHLHRDDAEFVDVYHTDYKQKMRVGFILGIGHVDFYEKGGDTSCKPISQQPEDSLQIWRDTNARVKTQISICRHNLAAHNFIAAMSKNCSIYGVYNLKDPCQGDNCIPIGFMASDYITSEKAGGRAGNYVYNSSACVVGVPISANGEFKNIYNEFQGNKHPLIEKKSWTAWISNTVLSGIYVVADVVAGVFK